MKKIIVVILAIAILGISFVVISENNYKNNLQPVASEADKVELKLNIPKGSSVRTVAAILESHGMIRDAASFIKYCKENRLEEKLQAGDYKFNNAMDIATITNKMVNGEVELNVVKVTIPEGYEIRQIADKLEEAKLIDRAMFMDEIANGQFEYDFTKDLPLGEFRLEGYLFPATYEIYADATEHEIIDMMLKKFDSVYNAELRQQATKMGRTTQEIITMASIIEREARVESDRKIISGVFYNRLKKNMKLESCATVQYALGERKEVLLYKDLEIESPYNTYINVGLPPAPIASPGEASIIAALYPDEVPYYFFVAKKDGSHVFTKTYKEHLAAQKQINEK